MKQLCEACAHQGHTSRSRDEWLGVVKCFSISALLKVSKTPCDGMQNCNYDFRFDSRSPIASIVAVLHMQNNSLTGCSRQSQVSIVYLLSRAVCAQQLI